MRSPRFRFAHSVLALAALLALASCSSVPSLLVSGVVVDSITGKALGGARVSEGRYAPDLAAGAMSGPDGTFSYRTYPEEHSILVEREGYETWRLTIGLRALSKSEVLRVVLVPKR